MAAWSIAPFNSAPKNPTARLVSFKSASLVYGEMSGTVSPNLFFSFARCDKLYE
jgi:hypothetical protein